MLRHGAGLLESLLPQCMGSVSTGQGGRAGGRTQGSSSSWERRAL